MFASNDLTLHQFYEPNAKVMQLDKLKVSAPSVLRMIPDETLAKLAKDTKVDYCAKVLKGERLFPLARHGDIGNLLVFQQVVDKQP